MVKQFFYRVLNAFCKSFEDLYMYLPYVLTISKSNHHVCLVARNVLIEEKAASYMLINIHRSKHKES